MKDILYQLFKDNGRISKTDISNHPDLPSYNTLMRRGFSLIELNQEFSERQYNDNPVLCLQCSTAITLKAHEQGNKFCCKSCSATHNNLKRGKKTKETYFKIKPPRECLHCKSIVTSTNKRTVFCSTSCSIDYQYQQNVADWLSGKKPGCNGKTLSLARYVRRYLHETRGTACECCGWDQRHPVDGRVLTEIDHIDGNAANNDPTNLKVLCPNCHSMTPTHRARNRNSARQR
ncbi:HNH endonuclease [Ochrobactrum phage vB_OspM_OC]|nr:HNH endonuclease [Ochrobactrum phage vB_OspM_OC]